LCCKCAAAVGCISSPHISPIHFHILNLLCLFRLIYLSVLSPNVNLYISTQIQCRVAFKYCITYTFLHCVLILHVCLYVLLQLLAHLLPKFLSVSWLVTHQGPVFMSSFLSWIYQKGVKLLMMSSYSNTDCMGEF